MFISHHYTGTPRLSEPFNRAGSYTLSFGYQRFLELMTYVVSYAAGRRPLLTSIYIYKQLRYRPKAGEIKNNEKCHCIVTREVYYPCSALLCPTKDGGNIENNTKS